MMPNFQVLSSRRYSILRQWVLPLAIAVLLPCVLSDDSVRADGRVIFSIEDPSLKYKGMVATFGSRLREPIRVNVMFPPDVETDPYLCEYPKSLGSMNRNEINMRSSYMDQPVALIVAAGGPCSPEDKARILLKMQTDVSSNLKVLLLYGTNAHFPNAFQLLEPDDPSEQLEPAMDNIGILYLPYRHAARLKQQMNVTAVESDGETRFMQPGNELWLFEHSIEGSWASNNLGGGGYRKDGDQIYENEQDWNNRHLHHHKDKGLYALFSLLCLLLVPCFWAGFVVMAGGRLRFQRNEQGRIVGLQYVPPATRAPSPQRQRQEKAKTTLTKEEFDSLPEVTYTSKPTKIDDRVEAIDSSNDSDPELGLCVGGTGNEMQTSLNNDGRLNEHTSTSDHCAKWSECSICIEEFQQSDKITLLPRCQHAYHRACIQPWLLEKQNFCPLCKTPVLPETDQQTASDRSSEDGEDGASLAESRSESSTSSNLSSERTDDGSTNTQRRDEESTSG